ncbi:4-aminobutyrate--2-oxoglutarate transaminase [Neisseria animalis]|uniref:4-aminobutyrate--2-oxoglutarate transaminase n=1 Tax=Neisseria animalis TaxID=492 RepID=A0A5P3MQV4_NEIAN|nr:4-aminobutyrate--2-oxoglutarate transaminase [Neisseria animalis]QEY23908.1 4-aminobutyrate--2-oxoglutarate transaminase [Neisseria animalis]ROW32024.1 4-aminobutyrate--2-oxoglutarate transaminase [Neisseria animalis]VEE05841.1 acetylornithine/succinyldiaminopimelate aminotransferase (ACOAT; succinyldiaminopimelate transferase; DapATase) [Neisseria animalis]
MGNLQERMCAALPSGASVMCDWFAESAQNAVIKSSDGREIIDFAGGIGVLNTGHRHPKVVAAVAAQLEKFTHTAFQVVPYESYVVLAERINRLVPIRGAVKSQFFSSGAEAVENAVKIARAYTGRNGVIAFGGAFHGRTLLTLALTGKVLPYSADFGAMPAGVFHALYPSKTQNISVAEAVKSIKRIFKSDIAPHDVAAVILEPVQGEGGFNVCPPEFMRAVREICDEHGILMIADEVQSGFARTGKLFAMEHYDVCPDIMTMAKSMAGGFVLSGVSGRAEVMDAPRKGGLGGTYAGNPLGVAAAGAVLDVIEEENLCGKARLLGGRLIGFLQGLEAPEVSEVRGLGAMVAVEFGDDEQPDPEFAARVRQYAMEHGLLLLTCGAHGNVIRFLFPLTIEEELFDRALGIIGEAFAAARTK